MSSRIAWTSGFSVDADGCPRAYAPRGSGLSGLDYLANAGSPGNWYGIVTKNGLRTGDPVVQGASDPAPGYYVSATALQDRTKAPSDPKRYVDSATVPYIAIPRELLKQGVALGDVCWVQHGRHGCGAIVADVGPKGHYGEGSIALAVALGMNPSPKRGGIDSGVTFTVFPGTNKGWPRTVTDIQNQAKALYAKA